MVRGRSRRGFAQHRAREPGHHPVEPSPARLPVPSRGAGGQTWSVRDNIFRNSYEHVDGNQWRRCGDVLARPAQPGETIETLEGPATASDGDWVVRGADGEQWPVPAREFAERYAEPDTPATATADP